VSQPAARPADPDPNTRTTVRRFLAVVRAFLPLALAYARDRRRFLLFGRRRAVTDEDRRRRAEYLLATLLELGPTFIKVGQILSARPDVLPPAYIDELSSLQDKVPASDWADIEPVVEAELGPVDELFDEFDREPISGASLGQVYVARHAGEKVAVKVLRPNIRERVAADLVVVETLLPLVVRLAPPGQAFTMENLAEEFATTIRGEMDYAAEAARLTEVRENFADDPNVVVPPVVAERSTERVLTMEYVDGTKITDVDALRAQGVDPSALVERLAETYFQMIVEDGVFHADPHPGNLSVRPDGAIVFYDFGVVGRLSARRREQILEFYVALARDDLDRVIDAFIEMGALDPDADRELMREVFGLVVEQLRGRAFDQAEIRQYVREFQAAVGDLSEFPFRLPQDLALIVRVSTVLEGVTRTLDDEFDFVATVTDLVREQGTGDGVAGIAREEIEATVRATVGALFAVPTLADSTLTRSASGRTVARTAYADDPRPFRLLAVRIALALGAGVVGLAATALYTFGRPVESAALGGVGALAVFALARSFRRRDRATADIRAGARVAERSVGRKRSR
jgi:predicted unusual protein kinase regulating ubiquinone biosynthesis (AarF/ABC1/UbiB family)